MAVYFMANGAQHVNCSACDLRVLSSKIWGWLQVMQIIIQRTRPAWPTKTKLWMTLDCSRRVKEITMVSETSVAGGRHCFILASDKNKKDQKNLRSKLVDDCPTSSFHNGRYVMGHTSKTRKQCVCWYISSLLHVNHYLNFPYQY